MKKLAYRPEIDGIRAIAVGSVVLYHSQLKIFDYQIFKDDFIVNGNFTFSYTDHWSAFGEIYFGEKLIFNTKLKDILLP